MRSSPLFEQGKEMDSGTSVWRKDTPGVQRYFAFKIPMDWVQVFGGQAKAGRGCSVEVFEDLDLEFGRDGEEVRFDWLAALSYNPVSLTYSAVQKG
jgi:hypothetical protein